MSTTTEALRLDAWATCPYCGQRLYPDTARRTTDGWACTDRARCARLEDVQFMLATGETLPACASRLGLRDDALARWLQRHAPELVRGHAYMRSYPRERMSA